VLDQGSRRAACFLGLPCRALEASAHDERHRKFVRNGPPPHSALQGMSLEQDCAGHDLQTRRGCRKKLASPRWPQPVAESYPRCRVRRRNRGYQTASSSCRPHGRHRGPRSVSSNGTRVSSRQWPLSISVRSRNFFSRSSSPLITDLHSSPAPALPANSSASRILTAIKY
jgi:hypothetical protein